MIDHLDPTDRVRRALHEKLPEISEVFDRVLAARAKLAADAQEELRAARERGPKVRCRACGYHLSYPSWPDLTRDGYAYLGLRPGEEFDLPG